jgi:hypothetical protein
MQLAGFDMQRIVADALARLFEVENLGKIEALKARVHGSKELAGSTRSLRFRNARRYAS